ncbi:uncharacterized protein RMCT_3604 [Mycolicibacterium thermoresistibile]|uniref:Uncharacterized protein n=1 Tax=Mycolicibacterium thermoresistibile TaxID=1797 RepID=A0A100XHB2_MYCTH|nr:uncharacterized protein RMCT_3604 [Mycolicibacterium thermoresistibile]
MPSPEKPVPTIRARVRTGGCVGVFAGVMSADGSVTVIVASLLLRLPILGPAVPDTSIVRSSGDGVNDSSGPVDQSGGTGGSIRQAGQAGGSGR